MPNGTQEEKTSFPGSVFLLMWLVLFQYISLKKRFTSDSRWVMKHFQLSGNLLGVGSCDPFCLRSLVSLERVGWIKLAMLLLESDF